MADEPEEGPFRFSVGAPPYQLQTDPGRTLTWETVQAAIDRLMKPPATSPPPMWLREYGLPHLWGFPARIERPVQEIAACAATVEELRVKLTEPGPERFERRMGEIGDYTGLIVVVDEDVPEGWLLLRPFLRRKKD